MEYFFILIIFIIILTQIFTMKFSFKMTPVSNKCLAEYLPDKTLAIFSISANSKDIRVRLFDPNGNTVQNKENNNLIKITYTSHEPGNHQICLDNYGNSEVNIAFEVTSGIYAKDYTEISKKEKLKPVEINLQKMEDMMGFVIHEFENIMQSERRGDELNDSIANTISFFFVVVLVIMGFVGFIQVTYVKNHFKNRKLI